MKELTKLAKVAIVGRPNVGKSSLMNKILGKRIAITEKAPGITRDKKEELADWQGNEFILLDTGGWLPNPVGLEAQVSDTALEAIKESDVLIFLVDSRTGLTGEDAEMGRVLNRFKKPIFLVANKVDHTKHESEVWDFLSLGFGEPFAISALHGKGVADLLDAVIAEIKEDESENESEEKNEVETEEAFAVAIVGRPNVGKSTLFNRLVGEKRSIESENPGTTRDPVDTLVETEVGRIRFVDTAGMRRKRSMNERAEYYAMLRALESVDRADIALLVIEAKEGVTHQDQRLAERIEAAGCPILIIMNKWELCSTEEKEDLAIQVGKRLHFLAKSPLLHISALTGMGVLQIIPALAQTLEGYQKRISTKQVNDIILEAQSMHSPPKGGKVLYATQVATDPPTFIFFVNRKLPATYLRYLERKIRESYDFGNTPFKIRVKQRK